MKTNEDIKFIMKLSAFTTATTAHNLRLLMLSHLQTVCFLLAFFTDGLVRTMLLGLAILLFVPCWFVVKEAIEETADIAGTDEENTPKIKSYLIKK